MTLRKINYRYLSIFPVVLILMMGLSTKLFAQETSSKAYQQAYAYILSEQWPEAQKAFDDFLDRFPKSNFADAAHYWQCYTRDKWVRIRKAFSNAIRISSHRFRRANG